MVHYGVDILISGELHDSFSPEVQNLCRMIDIVKVKGSILIYDIKSKIKDFFLSMFIVNYYGAGED